MLIALVLGTISLIALYFHFKNAGVKRKELVLFGCLSTLGVVQWVMITIDKPFRIPRFIGWCIQLFGIY